jgi:hypothetical protein
MLRRLLTAVALAGAVTIPAAALAEETRFLGKDPHGPLAIVRGGVVREPPKNACRTWGRLNQTWTALGKLGEVVGKAAVTAFDRYDVTNCDELALSRTSGSMGVEIFVRGHYVPLGLAAWKPSADERTALAEQIRRRDAMAAKIGRSPSKEADLALEKRLLSFLTPQGQRYAVVGGRAISILRLEGHRWIEEYVKKPGAKEWMPDASRFMPVAALDMDGDGAFDIVMHELEDSGTCYGDATLTRPRGGSKWVSVGAGIYGSTA